MRFHLAASIFLLFAFGCTKDTLAPGESGRSDTDPEPTEEEDSGGGSPVDTAEDEPDCETIVTRTWPVDGASEHYYRDPIVFELSEPDETATVVMDVDGETTVSDDGLSVIFTPSVPLEPSTNYSVKLDYCYGEPEISFSTSHYGRPLEASTDLENAVYMLRFTDGEYTVGDNAGELMNAIFQWPILVQMQDVDGPYLNLMAALGKTESDSYEQNTCARTLLVEDIPTSALPMLSGGLNDQEFGAHGGLLRFDSFTFEGTIAADGATLGGIRYTASMGVAEMADLLPDFGDVDAVCTLASNLDIPCEPCDTDEYRLCIRVAAQGIPGVRVSTEMTPIDVPGVHEDCETEED